MISLNATIGLASAFFTLAFAMQHIFSYFYGKKYYKQEVKYLYAAGLFLGCFLYLLGQAYLENSRFGPDELVIFWHKFQHIGLFGVLFFLPLLIFDYTKIKMRSWIKWGTAVLAFGLIAILFTTGLFIENTVYLLNNYLPHGKEGPLYNILHIWIATDIFICIYQLVRKLPSKSKGRDRAIPILLTGMGLATITAIFDLLGTIITVTFLSDVSLFSYGVTSMSFCFAYEFSSSSIKTSGKLAQANETIQEQEKALIDAARMHMAGRLASGIVHDMRNVLSIISLANANLEMLSENEELLQVVEQQRTSIDMGSFFLENLYGFAKEGRLTYDKSSRFSPLQIMNDLEKMLQANFKNKHINFSYSVPATVVLRGTKSYFMQVSLNILFNAFQAVPPNGNISVACKKNEEYVHFYFQDDGPGIPEEKRGDVFEFMYSTKKSGSGIGLFVTRNIVEKSKGTIKISDSAPGCLFEVSWPSW